MIMNRSKIYELDSTIDNIEVIKNRVMNDIFSQLDGGGNGEYANTRLDLDLAIDEVLMNTMEHSSNRNSKFKITYNIEGNKIGIIISDCAIIDINDKSVKVKLVNEDVLVNTRNKKSGGMGLFTVRHVVDGLGIFRVFKNGNKKPSGMIVAISKTIPQQIKGTVGLYA